jgi:hypothetical protein
MPKLSAKQMKAAIEAFKEQFTPGFFHGSPSPNITAFDPLKSTVRDTDFVTPGVTFVTKSPKFADSFTNGKGPYISLKTGDAMPAQSYTKGATMYPVSIDMSNHFDPTTPEGFQVVRDYVAKKYADDPKMAAQFKSRILDPHSNWTTMESPSFLQHLRDTGHTSFAVNESGYQNVGVLDPSKIRGKFAEYNPEEAASADFMKADGGAVQGYAVGGRALVGALEELAKPLVNRLSMSFKDVTKRIPELQESAQNIMAGTGTREMHEALVNIHKPVTPYSFVPQPATIEDATRALTSDKVAKFGQTDMIPPGHQVGLRLDIPAYRDHGVWINSIHNQGAKDPNFKTAYSNVSAVKNASFTMPQDEMLQVAAGASKTPKARINGEWSPVDQESAVANAQEYLNHPDWRQVGMDPERHGYFYDRATMEPITHAEEALQIGPLVLAKKPVYGKKEDFKFKKGGLTALKKKKK